MYTYEVYLKQNGMMLTHRVIAESTNDAGRIATERYPQASVYSIRLVRT